MMQGEKKEDNKLLGSIWRIIYYAHKVLKTAPDTKDKQMLERVILEFETERIKQEGI